MKKRLIPLVEENKNCEIRVQDLEYKVNKIHHIENKNREGKTETSLMFVYKWMKKERANKKRSSKNEYHGILFEKSCKKEESFSRVSRREEEGIDSLFEI